MKSLAESWVQSTLNRPLERPSSVTVRSAVESWGAFDCSFFASGRFTELCWKPSLSVTMRMRARWSGFVGRLAVSAAATARDMSNDAKHQTPTAIETDFNQRRLMRGLLEKRGRKAGRGTKGGRFNTRHLTIAKVALQSVRHGSYRS